MSIKYETFPPYSADEQVVVDEFYLLNDELIGLEKQSGNYVEGGKKNRIAFLKNKVRQLSIQIESFG